DGRIRTPSHSSTEPPMLHMVVMKHTAESCPGKPGNEAIQPCVHALDANLAERGVRIVGRWADPPAHVSYLALDAPNAHVIVECVTARGRAGYTTTDVRPVMSMD